MINEDDQKIKTDAGKLKLTLVPTSITKAVCRIMMFGLTKYPKDSWRTVIVERYRDALYRHLLAYLEDPKGNDEESGYPHLWHVACNVAFLIELEELNDVD